MYSYVLDGESSRYFAFKGVKDTSIARYCDGLLSGIIKFVISEEIVFRNNEFKIRPIKMGKKTEIVYKKREIINKFSDTKKATYVCLVGVDGISKMVKNDTMEYVNELVGTKPIVLDRYDGDLEKEEVNVLTR